jgi:hypothetical protein
MRLGQIGTDRIPSAMLRLTMTGSVAQSRRSRRPVNQSKMQLSWRSPSFALHSTSQIYPRRTSRCEKPCPRLPKHLDQRYAVSDIWYVVGRSARHGEASLNGPHFVSNRRNNSPRQSQRALRYVETTTQYLSESTLVAEHQKSKGSCYLYDRVSETEEYHIKGIITP